MQSLIRPSPVPNIAVAPPLCHDGFAMEEHDPELAVSRLAQRDTVLDVGPQSHCRRRFRYGFVQATTTDFSLSFVSNRAIQGSIAETPVVGLASIDCFDSSVNSAYGLRLRPSPAPPLMLPPAMVNRYSIDHGNPRLYQAAVARLPATATTIAGPGVAPRRDDSRSQFPTLQRLGDPRRGRRQGHRARGSSSSSSSGCVPTRVIPSACRPLGRAAATGAAFGSWRFSGAPAAGRCHGSVASGWSRRAQPGSEPARPTASLRWPPATPAATFRWSAGFSAPLAGCGSRGCCWMSAVGLAAVAAWLAIRPDWRADRRLARVGEKSVGIKADFAANKFDYCSAPKSFCRSAERGGS